MEPASNLTGLSEDGSDAPLASDASLGLPASRSNTPENDDFSGVGPNDIDGNVADLDDDGVSGDRLLGQASPGGSNGSVDGIAPSAVETSLGLSDGRSSSQGDDNVSGMGPNDVDGSVPDPGDGASGDHTLGLLTGGHVDPPASPGGTNGLVDGSDPFDNRDGCRPDGRWT